MIVASGDAIMHWGVRPLILLFFLVLLFFYLFIFILIKRKTLNSSQVLDQDLKSLDTRW